MRTRNMNKKSDAFICSLNNVDYTVIDKLVGKRKYPIFIYLLYQQPVYNTDKQGLMLCV